MTSKVRKIKIKNELLGILLSKSFDKEGVNFITPNELTLQLGIHNRKKGEESKAHKHIPIPKLTNVPILEVFFIEKGKVRLNFFDDNWKKIKSIVLKRGDIFINTTTKAHSLEYLTKTKMIEVKQGPYRSKKEDKIFK
jgi:hypothetical protein